jgi:hypothetical protein
MEKVHRYQTGIWVWLFPLTYLFHIAEEYWAGQGFPAWLSNVAGINLTPARFLGLNTFALIFMTVSIAVTKRTSAAGWFVTSIAAVVSINALAHLVGSVVTRSYSPGLISGFLLWFPLGIFTLHWAWKVAPRRTFVIGVLVGMFLHIIVMLLALMGGGT